MTSTIKENILRDTKTLSFQWGTETFPETYLSGPHDLVFKSHKITVKRVIHR